MVAANDPQFQAFLHAELMQESGGNSRAVSPAGALGTYQVMPGNIPSWSMEALGHSVSVQEFLNNPALQTVIVTRKLLDYVNKFGYRGAAAAWYSGNPSLANDTRPQNGGPSIADYVNQVMGRMSSAGHTPPTMQGTSAFGFPAAAPIPSARPTFDWWSGVTGGQLGYTTGQANESVGLIQAFIGQDPELQKLYSDAVAGNWSQDRFIGVLQATNWWKTNSQSVRNNLALKNTDPATYQKNLTASDAMIRELATSLGVPISPNALHNLTNTVVMMGYNESQVRSLLSTYLGDLKNGHYGGYAGQVELAMREYAADQGIPLSDKYIKNAVTGIVAGTSSLNTNRAWIQTQAALAFPAYAKQINEGVTVGEIAHPYAVSLAQILEQDPNSVDLFNPLLRGALTHAVPQNPAVAGSPMVPAPLALTDYQVQLRQHPAWLKTNNARESVMAGAGQVLSDLGLIGTSLGNGPATSPNSVKAVSPGVAATSGGLSGMTSFSTLQGKQALSNPSPPGGGGQAASLAPDTAFSTTGTPKLGG